MSFLNQVVRDLKSQYGAEISDFCIVVPTRRAVVFLREALAAEYRETLWAPRMVSIQDFIRDIVEWQFPDILPLVYELYQVYKIRQKEDNPAWNEDFERFYAWGEMLVKDFDEVDKYEVNAEQLFTNIRDLKEIEAFFTLDEENLESIRQFWQTIRGRNEDLTEVQEEFLRIWQILHDVYKRYRETLRSQNLAYDGMAYRHISAKLESGEIKLPYRKIVFAGFNALSTAEENIMHHLLKEEQAIAYWDVDKAYFDEEKLTQAAISKVHLLAGDIPGKFIREYQNKWKELDSKLIINDMAATPKEIFISGVPLQVGQAKYLGNLLQDNKPDPENYSDSAIILADENLLFPVLYSLPADIDLLNITMGFPLKQTNIFHLLITISRMIKNLRWNDGAPQFNYQQVLEILNNPYIKARDAKTSEDLYRRINKKNLVYVPEKELREAPLSNLLNHIFTPPRGPKEQLTYYEEVFRQLLEDSQERGATLEAEYTFHLFTQFNQLKEVLNHYKAEYSISGFSNLFREVIQKVRVPFEGEPLIGVQLMGFLETRVLDFKKIYILSSNEGNLPDTSSGNSFIPYSLRKGFGLPTFEEKDTIYAYHFYRLLQRAEEVHLIYNSVVEESGGAKEISRYIRQIRHFFRDQANISVQERIISTPAPYYEQPPIVIEQTEETVQLLRNRYQILNGQFTQKPYFSATALTSYLGCSLRFYFRYVAGIKEQDQVAEIMEANTFGSVLHETMELLYEECQNQVITPDLIKTLKKRLPEKLKKAFQQNELDWDELQGKNYLLRDVIQKLCERILRQDQASEPFKVISLEEDKAFLNLLKVDGEDFKLNGMFDRVDLLTERDVVRIVDYKTGKVDLKSYIPVEDTFNDDKYKEAFQGYLYAWLYDQKYPDTQLQVGYYTVRHLSEGFNYLNGGKVVTREELNEFETRLMELISRILTDDFVQTEEEAKCRYCPYRGICNR